MIESAVLAILNAESSVTDLVGPNIYVTHAPQYAKPPYIIVDQIASEEFPTFDNVTSNLRFATIDVDCYELNSLKGAELSRAVRSVLKDYVGSIGGVNVQAVVFDGGENHTLDRPNDGSDLPRHVYGTSYQFQFDEV